MCVYGGFWCHLSSWFPLDFCSCTSAVRQRFPRLLKLVSSDVSHFMFLPPPSFISWYIALSWKACIFLFIYFWDLSTCFVAFYTFGSVMVSFSIFTAFFSVYPYTFVLIFITMQCYMFCYFKCLLKNQCCKLYFKGSPLLMYRLHVCFHFRMAMTSHHPLASMWRRPPLSPPARLLVLWLFWFKLKLMRLLIWCKQHLV